MTVGLLIALALATAVCVAIVSGARFPILEESGIETDEDGFEIVKLKGDEEIPALWREGYLHPNLEAVAQYDGAKLTFDEYYTERGFPPRMEIAYRAGKQRLTLHVIIDRSDDKDPIRAPSTYEGQIERAYTVVSLYREGDWAQARFYYIGTLYVLDVRGEGRDLMEYLEILLPDVKYD